MIHDVVQHALLDPALALKISVTPVVLFQESAQEQRELLIEIGWRGSHLFMVPSSSSAMAEMSAIADIHSRLRVLLKRKYFLEMNGYNRDEKESQGTAASVPGLRLGIDSPLSGEPSPEFTDAHRQVAKEILSRWDGSTDLELTEEDILGLLPNGLTLGRYRITAVLNDLSHYWCAAKVRGDWRISTLLGSIDIRSRGNEEHYVLHFPTKFGKLMKRRLDHI